MTSSGSTVYSMDYRRRWLRELADRVPYTIGRPEVSSVAKIKNPPREQNGSNAEKIEQESERFALGVAEMVLGNSEEAQINGIMEIPPEREKETREINSEDEMLV